MMKTKEIMICVYSRSGSLIDGSLVKGRKYTIIKDPYKYKIGATQIDGTIIYFIGDDGEEHYITSDEYNKFFTNLENWRERQLNQLI